MNLGGLCEGVPRSCSCHRCCDWGGGSYSIASHSRYLALSLGLALQPPFPTKFVNTPLGTTLQQQCASPHAHRHFPRFQRRIHPKMGFDLLIKAFAAVAPNYLSLQLVNAGPD